MTEQFQNTPENAEQETEEQRTNDGWFDGTYGTTEQEIIQEYPVAITNDLRTDAQKTKLAFINRFAEGDPLLTLSDPHLEMDYHKVFYHVFFGEDAERAREAVTRFVAEGHGCGAKEIGLFRQKPNRLFTYGYGEICADMLTDLALLMDAAAGSQGKNTFAVPLKVFFFSCPVCGMRTLQWRGEYDICEECGWEDDGTDNEDEETVPNGDETIRTYRKKYLKHKQKDPYYKWFHPEKFPDDDP